LSTAPTFEFEYAYQLPSDFIRIVTMGEEDDELTWRIEGTTLVTNETEANIIYIKYVSDTIKWSAKFCSSVSYLLAAKAANVMAGMDTSKKAEALKAYSTSIADAATIDSQNAPLPIQRPNRWHNARF
jgi:hypothetical protein